MNKKGYVIDGAFSPGADPFMKGYLIIIPFSIIFWKHIWFLIPGYFGLHLISFLVDYIYEKIQDKKRRV